MSTIMAVKVLVKVIFFKDLKIIKQMNSKIIEEVSLFLYNLQNHPLAQS